MSRQRNDNLGRSAVDSGRNGWNPIAAGVHNGFGVARQTSATDRKGWRGYHGRRVTVYVPESYTEAYDAPAILRDAERILDELQSLLAPGEGCFHDSIVIYVSSAGSEPGRDDPITTPEGVDSDVVLLTLPSN